MGSMLVPYPEKKRNHIDFQSGLVRNVAGAKREVEVLHEEEDVWDIVYPLSQTRVGGRLSSNGRDESRNLRAISVPEKEIQ